ncbi:unnamed protein product [Urochloa decumbens]|uniref:non-specific serine/threonine protein kinase n=1 Tax=Urochloa decumbens TaxID=240449 RepID=A0ABC9EDZ8_9POAL
MEDLGEHMAGPPYLLRHRRLMDIAPASPSDSGHSGSKGMTIMVSILVVVIFCTLFYCIYCWRWRKRNAVRRAQIERLRPLSNSDLPIMDLSSIHEATNSFSKENKLGEGGFGPVYRGVLSGGAEIAVKRLSARSRQGAAEFRNEVELIAKLQHRNLVRLLGCCVEREEKMLIYEYLPNRSLDAFLFDTRKSGQLDWKMRQSIILGIARGMLYLHEDSCLKVIHRDLKASNVLLDNKMNPKISDFGMAKIFEEESNEVNTGRVVGTYGYMAPEYAMEGVFSVKSDVFSFGVLVLEILSGQRNGSMYLQEHQHTLIQDVKSFSHVISQWKNSVSFDPKNGANFSSEFVATGMEAVERGQGVGVHGRVAGGVVLAGRGVAVLPRRAAVRTGEPGSPAHHVQRGAHAHQRPDADAGAGAAAAVREVQEGVRRVRFLARHEDRDDQDAVRQ